MKIKLSSELLMYPLKRGNKKPERQISQPRRHGILQRKNGVPHHDFSERPETLTQELSRCSSIHGEMVGFPKEMVVQIHY